MKTALLSLAAVALFASTVGCSAAAEDDTAGAAGAASAAQSGLSVTLKEVDLGNVNGKCTSAGKMVQAGIGNGVAAATVEKVNARLSRNMLQSTGEDCANLTFTFEMTMTVKHNAKGFLSIGESGYSYSEGAAHDSKFVLGHNIDLATGAVFKAKDILTQPGAETAAEVCAGGIQKLRGDHEGFGVDADKDSCARALGYDTSFTFDKSGIRLHPSMSGAEFVFEAEGVLIPWTVIDRNLTARGVEVMNATK